MHDRKQIKHKIIIIYILVFNICCFSQNADSLKNLLNKSVFVSDKVRILNQLADYYSQREQEVSFEYAKEAIALAIKHNLQKEIAYSYNSLGNYYINKGTTDTAIFYLMKALSNALRLKNVDLIGKTYNNLGVACSQNDVIKAKDFYIKAINIYKNHKLYIETGKVIGNLGNLNIQLGQYDEALKYFFEASKYDSLAPDPVTLALSYNSIGVAYHYKGNYHKALQYYFFSLKIYEKIKHESYISVMYHNIGCVYFEYKNYDKALEFYNKSVEIKKKLKNEAGIAYSQIKIAIINLELNRINDALELFTQALGYFEKVDNKQGLSIAYRYLGQIHYIIKDFIKSKYFFNRAIILSQQLNDKVAVVEINQFLGKIQKSNGDINGGLLLFKKALSISQEMGNLKLQKSLEKDIADIFIQSQKYESAIPHFMNYIVLNDSLFNIENRKIVLELESRYESEKKELALQMALKDKKLQNIEIKKQKLLRNALIIGAILVMIILLMVFNNAIQKILLKNKNNIKVSE